MPGINTIVMGIIVLLTGLYVVKYNASQRVTGFVVSSIGVVAICIGTYQYITTTAAAVTVAATTRPATTVAATTRPATTVAAETTAPAADLVTLFESECSAPARDDKREGIVDQNVLNAIAPYLYYPESPSASDKPGLQAPKIGDSEFVLKGSLLSDEANFSKVRAALKQAIVASGRDVVVLISHNISKTSATGYTLFIFMANSSINLSAPPILAPPETLKDYNLKIMVLAIRSSKPAVIRGECGSTRALLFNR